ncbi:fagellar hook-basal body protein [Solidesulfovibrio fructosivorans JJ]]|uniref:Flagellar hook protein FlgE n=1 Tax=Solidesulfovibrio fructosivorans JJ] TaxID=596151 RepID=E1K1J3_SOLFR|nr:flagellar hook-basal body complex protein [Solidesulfovibrio fructosivorans]EFL49548.1 fagellar hook-basal body protein [Solidesulfovibrio fructosivorans JJ]]
MSAIWTGVSGLLSYSTGIANTGNNLANTGTTGYKSSRLLFADMISEMAGGTSDGSQIGTGVQVGSVSMTTSTGSPISASQSMDMAINGERGYFVVKKPGTDKTYYTRDGAFNFDVNGYLTTETGLNVQGWAVDQTAVTAAKRTGTVLSQVPTTGTLTDIQIKDYTSAAQATSAVTMITNLDGQTEPGTLDATDPYFSMFKRYNADNSPPISNTAYSAPIKVYDSEGGTHTLTTYYSKVSDENGKEYWEYMVTMPPEDDGSSTTSGTSKAGVLMIGTLTFSAQGELENETAFTPSGSDPTDLASWTQASLDGSGNPKLNATFRSASNSSNILSSQPIVYKDGLSSSNASWSASAPATAADIGTLTSANAGFNSANTKNAATCTSNYSTSSYTASSTQDGYASGTLLSTSVDENGVISGTFSNGQTIELFVVGLADFVNPTDLYREGNNLLSATKESGDASLGRANSGVFDSVSGYTLESSNVDMATEMVNLITLQRAFQSNSKVVTTADEMMQKALEIKR